jgi:hypothetical protein
MTVLEIRPHRWGWKVFEAAGVETVFREQAQAIGYAETRACFRSGEIRILNSIGNVGAHHPIQRSGSEAVILGDHPVDGHVKAARMSAIPRRR